MKVLNIFLHWPHVKLRILPLPLGLDPSLVPSEAHPSGTWDATKHMHGPTEIDGIGKPANGN